MQGTHILIGNKFFMHLGFSKTYLRFVIKSGYSIRVPPAIADPALGKKVFPRKTVYRIFGRAPPKNLLYFLSPLRTDLFIRVNIQDPVMASPVCTQIFLFTVPVPIHAKNLIGELPANFHSTVRTVGIQHNNFIGPFYTHKASRNILLLIFGNDCDRQLFHKYIFQK